MSEQSCESCQWWRLWVGRDGIGQCMYPVPIVYAQTIRPITLKDSGQNCKTWTICAGTGR